MGVRRLIRKMMEASLKKHHYQVRHESEADRDCTMEAALRRAALREFHINSVIDVGASDGAWTLRAMRVFPDHEYLLIEANSTHTPGLETMCQRFDNVRVVHAAAGDKAGELYFDNTTSLGGAASHEPLPGPHAIVNATTIDLEVERAGLQPGYCLKLDTHGFEVPIFLGATRTLEQTQLIIVEAYNFQITDESLRFHQLCGFLEDRGFRVIDMADPGHRPRDLALWQMDLFFARADRQEFRSASYR